MCTCVCACMRVCRLKAVLGTGRTIKVERKRAGSYRET